MTPSSNVLLIGYGNELRGDDAAGPKMIEAAAGWQLPTLRTVTCHQLTPELAEAIANASAVVFIDAAVNSQDPSVQAVRIEPQTDGHSSTHSGDPRWLLALAQKVFHRCPPAWLITIPGENFEFGEGLSPAATRGLATAETKLKKICDVDAADPAAG